MVFWNDTKMKLCQSVLHGAGGEHRDVFQTKRLEDVVMEVVVERHAGNTLHTESGKIDACLRYWSVEIALLVVML